jgi:hypothetical protein
MSEYHGGWFQVRIPEDAHSGLAAYQMLWLDRTGDVLASSGKALFRISADMPLDDRRSGAGVDTGAGKGRTQIKPRPDDDVGNARDGGVQGTTMSGKTKQLKTPVVDYVVIIGGDGVEVRGGRYPFEFTLPSDARLNDRGVLTFLVNGEDKGGPPVGEVRGLPVFNIKINGHEVESITLANLVTRAWTVTFDARILQSGRNEIIFSGAGGGYRVKVTDAVLWFHRDIAW